MGSKYKISIFFFIHLLTSHTLTQKKNFNMDQEQFFNVIGFLQESMAHKESPLYDKVSGLIKEASRGQFKDVQDLVEQLDHVDLNSLFEAITEMDIDTPFICSMLMLTNKFSEFNWTPVLLYHAKEEKPTWRLIPPNTLPTAFIDCIVGDSDLLDLQCMKPVEETICGDI